MDGEDQGGGGRCVCGGGGGVVLCFGRCKGLEGMEFEFKGMCS